MYLFATLQIFSDLLSVYSSTLSTQALVAVLWPGFADRAERDSCVQN